MTKTLKIHTAQPALYASEDGESTITIICSDNISDSRMKQYESKLEATIAMVKRMELSYKQAEQICNESKRKPQLRKIRSLITLNRILLSND